MKTVAIHLKDRDYRILIGPRLLTSLGRFLKEAGFAEYTFVVVSQKPVWVFAGQAVVSSLSKEMIDHALFLLPAAKSSEANKTQGVWTRLIKFLASKDG